MGQIPMNQNGRIVCVPYSPPSGMFMPMGPSKSIAYGMGQMTAPYLTQAERDKLLLEIQGAMSKVRPIDDLFVWSVDNDPGLKKYLGQDASRFMALSNSIAPLYPSVEAVANRLADTDAENWYVPDAEEYAAIKQWATGINEMFKLMQAHRALPYTPPVGTKPPPTTAPTGVVKASGTPTAPTGAAGISTETMLIGGAVAIGLGLLVAALV
jgi:hypothetical protein